MARRMIVKIGEDILRKRAKEVVDFDDNLGRLLDDMKETMYANDGVGLAAVQVGILKRVVVIDCGDHLYELVNPEIIESDGKTCVCETLSDKDYISLLDQKLNEELAEYQESKSLEELADLLEVIQAVVKARGWTLEELEQVRANKAAKRGGFDKKILLKEVSGG